MKGTLTFNLPEEQVEFLTAQKGIVYQGALQDMDNYLRGRLKHEELSDDVSKALQDARDYLNSLTEIWSNE